MASSSQVRSWWAGYQRNTARYVKVDFPGEGKWWSLWVADKSAPVWEAVAQIMQSEPYLFRESAGGTYNPREPGSTSLHTYTLALDLNPSQNPMRNPLVTDMPPSFIARMEGIRASGNQAMMWGGRWPASNPPDAMHWQINVSPADCINVTWDKGGSTPAPGPLPDEEDDLSPSDFAKQLDVDRLNALINAKVAGSWVIAPGDANRQGQANYWAAKLPTPADPEWADFYRGTRCWADGCCYRMSKGQVLSLIGLLICWGILMIVLIRDGRGRR